MISNVILTAERSGGKILVQISPAVDIPMFRIADTGYQTGMLNQVEARCSSYHFITKQITSSHNYYPGWMVILEHSQIGVVRRKS